MKLSEEKKKAGWQIVRFDEIAREVKKTTKDPAADGLEYYVGLEHLDPQSLRLQRKGVIAEDTPTFTRCFKPGQILFGKRRAYQKKAAIADFEGICSGDIIVMEEVVGKIIPGLLPFVVQSDMFFEYAVKTSSGSLSPRTKWKTLAEFQFPLPPLDRQKAILEVLEKMGEVCMLTYTFINNHQVLENAVLTKLLESFDNLSVLTGQELLNKNYLYCLKDGNHGSQYPKSSEFVAEGAPYLSAQYISEFGEIDFEGCPKLAVEKAESLRIPPAQGGDVILTHNATIGRVAIIPSNINDVVASTSTTYYRVNPKKLSREYLAVFLKSPFFQGQLFRVMKQSTRNQVPISQQKKLIFRVPDILVQNQVVDLVSTFLTPRELRERMASVNLLKQRVFIEMFDSGLIM